MTKPIIDDASLARMQPYEADAVLERLRELYKEGVSAREMMELTRLEKALKAKAGVGQ